MPSTVHVTPSDDVDDVNVLPDLASLIQLGILKSRDARFRDLDPAASLMRKSAPSGGVLLPAPRTTTEA